MLLDWSISARGWTSATSGAFQLGPGLAQCNSTERLRIE